MGLRLRAEAGLLRHEGPGHMDLEDVEVALLVFEERVSLFNDEGVLVESEIGADHGRNVSAPCSTGSPRMRRGRRFSIGVPPLFEPAPMRVGGVVGFCCPSERRP